MRSEKRTKNQHPEQGPPQYLLNEKSAYDPQGSSKTKRQ